MGAGRTDALTVLPSKDQLLAALRGHYLLGPLCTQAFGLAELHRQRRDQPERAARIDSRRAELVGEIDDWADAALPAPRADARTATEPLGVTIDRMASASALAFHLLMTGDPAGDEMHAAWTRLAELEIAYGELSAALLAGYRRLPVRDGADR
ncbi:DUF4254 domain-containing protein [Nocardia bovistercoris]|uniref:DUF4254 domain-containing protein n=1 Tax=Nocardia bovistercoris TaxID=2785916 RepID=A0A931I9P4_9NOCA|nr:DUF4254 domain-containing protein [Nocardia bovistercoris]MBH0776445.1 DUF4254 domain-containing protein [Nocardia bovistercoris]